MQKTISLKVLPEEVSQSDVIRRMIAAASGVKAEQVSGYYFLKSSLDARGKTIWCHLTVQAFIGEPFQQRPEGAFAFREVHRSPHRVVIIGAGPAGLFAALYCLEQGIKPIVLERGKDVRSRRRDLALMNREGVVNPESNYCFGEGGAGTYSDGKLYTRSTKRGDVQRILKLLVHFGAPENILYESHPHIGTNKLPHIITAMRETILACGGDIHFEQKVTGFLLDGDELTAVKTASGNEWKADAFVLATGHSARDIFELLHEKGIRIESKPFALGVRAEHPQALVDAARYHCLIRSPWLPPAAYSLVHQSRERGVFSFCMCPGGIIAPAATAPGEIVVNGWSPSKRNNPFANSGIVAEIRPQDLLRLPADFTEVTGKPRVAPDHPLSMLYFQQYVEKKSYLAGGGLLQAPAQRLADFVQGRSSASLPDCSHLPGVTAADLNAVLPAFVAEALREGFAAFGRTIKGYLTNEALIVATESRTSSPVRIPRQEATHQHPGIKKLFPCAEGAGYAGGIVSAAMDGENTARKIQAMMNW